MAKKVRTLDSFKFGQKNIIPYAGEVEFDENGIIEVEDDAAMKLVALEGLNFQLVEEDEANEEKARLEAEEKARKEAEDKVDTSDIEDVNDIEENIEESEDEDLQNVIDGLNDMTVEELKQTCEDGEYPKNEWKSLKKAELIEYIVLKLTADE